MVASDDELPLEPRTLSGVLDDVQVRGFAEHFRVLVGTRLRAIGAGSTFAPSRVSMMGASSARPMKNMERAVSTRMRAIFHIAANPLFAPLQSRLASEWFKARDSRLNPS